ncbi:MAG TPA: carboxypeptidase regulatory-like domain-containing protein, partial [Thermoplasmata archaeon]
VDLTNSTDGGSTWSAPLALAGLPATNVTLQVEREAAGDLDLLYLQTVGSGGAIREWLNFSRWSPATGVSAPRVLASGAGGTPGSIEIGGPVFTSDESSGTSFAGRLYAAWTQLTLGAPITSEIRARASADGGANWSAPVAVETVADAVDWGGAATVGVDGTLYLVWFQFTAPDSLHSPSLYRLMLAASVDGGRSFTPGVPLSGRADSLDQVVPPPVLADSSGGGVLVSWTRIWNTSSSPCPDCPGGTAQSGAIEAVRVFPEFVAATVLAELTVTGVASAPNGTLEVGPLPTLALAIGGAEFDLSAPPMTGTGTGTVIFSLWFGSTISIANSLTGSWAAAGTYHACYVTLAGAPCVEPGAPGTLRCSLDPSSATATVDGVVFPTSNGTGTTLLSPGAHLVGASAPGYASVGVEIDVTTANTTSLNLSLTELPVVIAGEVSPAFAHVSVDGNAIGVAPNGSFSTFVAVGSHQVDASAYGYRPFSASGISPTWDRPAYLEITLGPDPGTISGTVSPAGAEVTVGVLRIATANDGTFDLSVPAGNYTLAATETGYATLNLTDVQVRPGTETHVDIALLPLDVPFVGRVAPAGAELSVDGVAVPLDLTGAFAVAIPWGPHLVNISARGFSPVSEAVLLSFGANQPFNVSLAVSGGWLVGALHPSNASLFENGIPVSVSESGAFNVSLSPGAYQVRAVLPGFADWSSSVDVSPGTAANITVSLAPISAPLLSWATLSTGLALDAVVVGAVAVVFWLAGRRPVRPNSR